MPITVYLFPAEDRGNKYFSLLREALGSEPGMLFGATRSLWRIALRPAERTLVVIHWSTVLYGSRYASKSLLLLGSNVLALVLLRGRGGTIFWVMHNTAAHDYPHPWIDRLGRAMLRVTVHAVIVHQEKTRALLAIRYPQLLVVHIPHGNYIDAYGPRHDHATALVHYGFPKDAVVFLVLGMIRPYKRLEVIIDAFVEALPRMPVHVRLHIAGKGDLSYVDALRARALDERIVLENRFVPDEEIPQLLAASRYSVFHYDGTELTSGGIILSLSYGVPVVTRALPGAEMVREDTSGWFYDSSEELTDLFVILSERLMDDLDEVIVSVRPDTWRAVAHSYRALYDMCHG